MHLLEQLLANSLIAFGTTIGMVLLIVRRRDRATRPSSSRVELPPALMAPKVRVSPRVAQAPVRVERDRARDLLATAGAEALQVARPVGDQAALLKRISVDHLQANHPMFRPTTAPTGHGGQAARRPATIVHGQRRPGMTRPQRAPLHLVRRGTSTPPAPQQ